MPKISDAHREMRRAQILDAAWRCFQRAGVQATTIEDIIAESGLSASAMYRYFKGKDDIILAAIGSSLGGLSALLDPLLDDVAITSPAGLVARVTATIDAFSKRRGFHLESIAIHGWSEAQHNPKVRILIAEFYRTFRQRLGDCARRWRKTGGVDPAVQPVDVAHALFATILGHVVQTAVLHDADPKRLARGLAALRADGGQ